MNNNTTNSTPDKELIAAKLHSQLEVVKKWKPETFAHNAKWLKHYVQPLLNELYATEHPLQSTEQGKDVYANMPKWSRDRYSNWQEWAKACFDAGKKESDKELKHQVEVLRGALQKLVGIEAWIGDTKMKVLFQKTVYPALENK